MTREPPVATAKDIVACLIGIVGFVLMACETDKEGLIAQIAVSLGGLALIGAAALIWFIWRWFEEK